MAVAGIGGIGPFDSAKMAEAIFKKIDANGDGSLDKPEIQAATKGRIGPSPELILSKFDTNHDDKLSEAEFKDSLKKMGGPGGTGPKGGMPPGGMGRMPPGGAPPSDGKSGSSDMKAYDKRDLTHFPQLIVHKGRNYISASVFLWFTMSPRMSFVLPDCGPEGR